MTDREDPIVSALQNAVDFPVDVECEAYPDVIFNVILQRTATYADVELCANALYGFMTSYNKLHFLRPIHYVSDIDALPKEPEHFSVYIHVDFGGSGQKALCGTLRALKDTGLPIYRVILE